MQIIKIFKNVYTNNLCCFVLYIKTFQNYAVRATSIELLLWHLPRWIEFQISSPVIENEKSSNMNETAIV